MTNLSKFKAAKKRRLEKKRVEDQKWRSENRELHNARARRNRIVNPEAAKKASAKSKQKIKEQIRKMKDSLPVWRSIETAPKDGTRVLLFSPSYEGNDGGDMVIARWVPPRGSGQCGDFVWEIVLDAGTMAESIPTHWMPLPAPPEAAR